MKYIYILLLKNLILYNYIVSVLRKILDVVDIYLKHFLFIDFIEIVIPKNYFPFIYKIN